MKRIGSYHAGKMEEVGLSPPIFEFVRDRDLFVAKGTIVKNLRPRRKRMKRSNRLQAAKHWVPTYNGKNIIRGYQNWFGVDFQCAVHELTCCKTH